MRMTSRSGVVRAWFTDRPGSLTRSTYCPNALICRCVRGGSTVEPLPDLPTLLVHASSCFDRQSAELEVDDRFSVTGRNSE
jgi:hypothetical protein